MAQVKDPRKEKIRRISAFVTLIQKHRKRVVHYGNRAWSKVPSANEVKSVKDFLSLRGAGIDYLNTNLSSLLSLGGRVVKFASVFLHGTPKVSGYTLKGKKIIPGGICELGDLMTLFVYLAKDKTVVDLKALIFQAKRKASNGNYVVLDQTQRSLYDNADGFSYSSDTVQTAGTKRTLPKGTARQRALQYLFVDPRPALTRKIPADAHAHDPLPYGEHLFELLINRTGLKVGKKRGEGWSRIIWDILDEAANRLGQANILESSGLGGKNGLLNYFNSFEDKSVFHVSDGSNVEGGLGVQFVIVWDGDLDPPNGELTPVILPSSPWTTAALLLNLQQYQVAGEMEEWIQTARNWVSSSGSVQDRNILLQVLEQREGYRTKSEQDLFEELQLYVTDLHVQSEDLLEQTWD